MAIVGPGAVQELATDVKPLLEGASEYEYVTILNPLTDDFAVRVAQDVPVNMPMTIGKDINGRQMDERDLAQGYGVTKNSDFRARKHIVNDTIIKSGQTINLKGNEAQVAIRQLVNEIMQREGNQRLMSDPTLRNEVEQRIVISRGSVQELIDGGLQTQRSQIDAAISKSNEVADEQPFPGLANGTAEESSTASKNSGTESIRQERRSPGRPKKT